MKRKTSYPSSSDRYSLKYDKHNHALLYDQKKLVMVLNSKDTEVLKQRIEEKSPLEIQDILLKYVSNF